MELVFASILPLVTILVVGLLGSTRRIGFWGGIITSILLTPLGGFILALALGPKRDPELEPPPAETSK